MSRAAAHGWTWRYHAADNREVTVDGVQPEEGFPSQADAETWVGESWQELLEAGVDAVTLLREGEPVYGPMSLRPLE